jgi:hypothetical protein
LFDDNGWWTEMDEPSVLDYLKAKLTPWRGPAPQVPLAPAPADPLGEDIEWNPESEATPISGHAPTLPLAITIPWRTLAALFLALVAQSSFEPALERAWGVGVVLYGVAVLLLVWAYFSAELAPSAAQEQARSSIQQGQDAAGRSTIQPIWLPP